MNTYNIRQTDNNGFIVEEYFGNTNDTLYGAPAINYGPRSRTFVFTSFADLAAFLGNALGAAPAGTTHLDFNTGTITVR
jgi:hypothetical protein